MCTVINVTSLKGLNGNKCSGSSISVHIKDIFANINRQICLISSESEQCCFIKFNINRAPKKFFNLIVFLAFLPKSLFIEMEGFFVAYFWDGVFFFD